MRKKSENLADSQTGLNRSTNRSSDRSVSDTSSQRSVPFSDGQVANTAEAYRLVQRLRREIILRSEGRANILSSVDRLQYHITDLQIQLGKKFLQLFVIGTATVLDCVDVILDL